MNMVMRHETLGIFREISPAFPRSSCRATGTPPAKTARRSSFRGRLMGNN
jgi:hypothetical protein